MVEETTRISIWISLLVGINKQVEEERQDVKQEERNVCEGKQSNSQQLKGRDEMAGVGNMWQCMSEVANHVAKPLFMMNSITALQVFYVRGLT